MKQQKIKKRRSIADRWRSLSKGERTLSGVVVLLCCVCIGTVAFSLTARQRAEKAQTPQATREALLDTEGQWSKFDKYGFSVWMPQDLTAETLGDGLDDYMKMSAQRDKGHYPELVLGVFAVPDEEQVEYNLASDQSTVLDAIRPYLQNALGKMFNGVYPTISADIEVITLKTGEPAIQAKGEVSCTVVFQDPKDPENPYSEEVDTNIYYLCKIYHGRPIVAWGVWDYSTYEGESRTIAAVTDAITSTVRADDSIEIVEPANDTWDTVSPNYGAANPEPETPATSTWDEEKQAWINDETGEVDETLPPPTDPYWDDKRIEPEESETAPEVDETTETNSDLEVIKPADTE